MFLAREAVSEAFTGWTDVEIPVSQVAEVLLAKAAIGLGIRGHRLWQHDRNSHLLARQDL